MTPVELAEEVRQWRQREREAGRLPETITTPRMLAELGKVIATAPLTGGSADEGTE